MEVDGGDTGAEKLVLPLLGYVSPLLLGYFAFFQFHAYQAYGAAALLAVLGLASSMTVIVSRRTGVWPFNYICMLAVLGIVGTSYLRGGLVLPVLLWLFLPPVLCTLFFRFRYALLWVVVSAFFVLMLFVLQQMGLTPVRAEPTPAGILSGTMGAIACLSAVVVFQALYRRRDREEREHMQRRLFRANKLESVARLAGGIAHDFNNLLTVITNHAQILAERTSESSPSKEDVEAIQHAANAGAALTRRLLAIGRERADDEPAVPVDLNGVGAKVATLLRSLLPKDVDFQFSPAAEAAVVRANPWDIHQVLMNLVINARDAMPRGGRITMCIQLKECTRPRPLRFGVLPPGTYIVLKVQDQGVGMGEELMNQVVEPFFTTRGKRGGTGLGLSIVYGVATALQGQMDIESEIDVGTTFRVYLPFCNEPIPQPTRQRRTSAFPTRSTRILLVDDEPAVRRAVGRLLGLEGHDVTMASGPEEARQLFDPRAFDVLATDISMPGGSGVDLALELLGNKPELGVVFVSGADASVIDKHPQLSAPNVTFLTLPASRRDLRNAVRAVAPLIRRPQDARSRKISTSYGESSAEKHRLAHENPGALSNTSSPHAQVPAPLPLEQPKH